MLGKMPSRVYDDPICTREGIVMSGENKTVPVTAAGGILYAEELRTLADLAERFGDGRVLLTTRQTVEFTGVENETGLRDALKAHGLTAAPTGTRVRSIVCCKATLCSRGLLDSFAVAAALQERFTVGWRDTPLPHKCNIAVGGCPNNCAAHRLNDIGVEGVRGGYRLYLGGQGGRKAVVGRPLPSVFPTLGAVMDCIEAILRFYKENALPRERLGAMLERMGYAVLEQELAIQPEE